jgi:hypothetical protein
MGAGLVVEHLSGLGHERIDGGRDNRLIQAQLGLADLGPGLRLLKTLPEHDPDFVLLDGTLAERDRIGESRADYSAKHRRHGVNVQVVTDPVGEVLWILPALPGRTHGLTADRTRRIIRTCERQGVPILVDRTYTGAGSWGVDLLCIDELGYLELDRRGAEMLFQVLTERAQAEGLQLTGEGGLLQRVALECEITDHLGYDKHDAAGKNGGSSRNGKRSKTVPVGALAAELRVLARRVRSTRFPRLAHALEDLARLERHVGLLAHTVNPVEVALRGQIVFGGRGHSVRQTLQNPRPLSASLICLP